MPASSVNDCAGTTNVYVPGWVRFSAADSCAESASALKYNTEASTLAPGLCTGATCSMSGRTSRKEREWSSSRVKSKTMMPLVVSTGALVLTVGGAVSYTRESVLEASEGSGDVSLSAPASMRTDTVPGEESVSVTVKRFGAEAVTGPSA